MTPQQKSPPAPDSSPLGEAGPGQAANVGLKCRLQEGRQEQESINLNLIHDDLGLLLSKLI